MVSLITSQKENNYKIGNYEFNEIISFKDNADVFEQKTIEQELQLKEYILENKDKFLKTIPQILRVGKTDDQVFQDNLENILMTICMDFGSTSFLKAHETDKNSIEYLIDKSEPKATYLSLLI